MDFYTNLTFKVQKGRGLRSRDQVSKYWDPNNFWRKRAVRLKFGIDIANGPSLGTDHKTTPTWAWPGSRDRISKFCDPYNNTWTNWSICFKFVTEMEDGPLQRTEYKPTPNSAWPGSRDLISKFWTLITFERKVLSIEIWYKHRGRTLPA